MSYLPEFGDTDLQSRIDTIRQKNQPRKRLALRRYPLPAGAGVWVGDAPEDEPESIDATIHTLTAATRLIVSVLADSGVHPNLCESVEYQIHQLWSNALMTANPKAPDEFERNPEMPFSLKDAGKA